MRPAAADVSVGSERITKFHRINVKLRKRANAIVRQAYIYE
jgi:hypothetical protein